MQLSSSAYELFIKSIANKIFLLSQYQVIPSTHQQIAVSELIWDFTLACKSGFPQTLQGEKYSQKLVQLSVILL